MSCMCVEKSNKSDTFCNCTELAEGYKAMSRINLSLAEEAVVSDNEAMEICEQNFAECE